jgi:succinyl-CoA synthetase alpha subunit
LGVIISKKTSAIVQGITGTQGRIHTKLMLDYGTRIVAGVTPGKGGTRVHGVPVYNTVQESMKHHTPNASIIFVPAPFAATAAFEAIDGGLKKIVIVTEHMPVKDAIEVVAKAKKNGTTIIGPNTPGIITPEECKLGVMPAQVFKPGIVGIVSRSGTLTYEIALRITAMGLGQSTCIGIGGDPVIGLSFVEVLGMFGADDSTEVIVLIGEIGGNLEELAADFVSKAGYPKPVIAFVAGKSAPPGKRMGHAGAIITGRAGTAQSKIDAFREAGITVAENPSDVERLLTKELRKGNIGRTP